MHLPFFNCNYHTAVHDLILLTECKVFFFMVYGDCTMNVITFLRINRKHCLFWLPKVNEIKQIALKLYIGFPDISCMKILISHFLIHFVFSHCTFLIFFNIFSFLADIMVPSYTLSAFSHYCINFLY